MYCPGCKNEIQDGTKLCPYCQLYITLQDDEFKLCVYCGEKIKPHANTCRFCHHDQRKGNRQWFQKKRIVIPLLLLEFIVVATLMMSLDTFTSVVKEAEYRNNRLEVVGELSKALDMSTKIDSLQRFQYTKEKNIEIEYLIFSYTKNDLKKSNFEILQNLAGSLKKEGQRIHDIIIIANTPTGGYLTSKNQIGDTQKILIGTMNFADWQAQTRFTEEDLF